MSDSPITDIFYIVLELLIAGFSVLGNVLVCWAVGLNSNLQSITNFFVVSLAVADIAVGVLAIPFSIVISIGFCTNFYGCLFIVCFVLVLTQSSIFSLLAIAIDRYIAIKLPLRYNSLVTGERARGIIALCWVLSIIIGLTPMMGWNNLLEINKIKCNSSLLNTSNLVKCEFEKVMRMDYMVYFNFFVCVLIPLLLMLAIYLCIFMVARRQLKVMEGKVFHGEKSNSTLQKEVQAAKSLAIIVGLFAACWLPLHIINCYHYFCPKCDRAPAWIMFVAIILSHTNSVINPFIYAYRIREFRRTFRKIIQRHILGRQEQLGSEDRARNTTYHSISDSIRLKDNGLGIDVFPERSSGSGSDGSCPCPAQISPVGGGLMAVSHPPLSVVISNCPKVGSFPLHACRQPQIPLDLDLQSAEQQGDCDGAEVKGEKGKENISSAQVTSLLNRQNRKSSFSELSKAS